MRRFAALHEILRFHDELTHLHAADPLHAALVQSIRAGLRDLLSGRGAGL